MPLHSNLQYICFSCHISSAKATLQVAKRDTWIWTLSISKTRYMNLQKDLPWSAACYKNCNFDTCGQQCENLLQKLLHSHCIRSKPAQKTNEKVVRYSLTLLMGSKICLQTIPHEHQTSYHFVPISFRHWSQRNLHDKRKLSESTQGT